MNHFLLESKDIERDSFVWNMAGSLLGAFQSVILLMILTRTVDLVTAGVFTIANANSNLFLNIGKFGMRNYQVSDVRHEYSFTEYHRSRVYSLLLMLLCSVLYIVYASITNGYTLEKAMIILWMCIFKLPDAYEDVFYGEYQRCGRLDIGAKCMTIRMLATIVFFGVSVVLTKSLLCSMIVSTIFTIVLMMVLLQATKGIIQKADYNIEIRAKQLLMACFPVFAAAFLAFYIGNAPKYAIDAQLSDDLQAIYGFISMPVFVIGLLNGFIFNPILFSLSCMWDKKQLDKFTRSIINQSVIVSVITVICIAGAYVLGIPVLSILYNTDLTNYKAELLWLLVGGGLLGLSGVFTAVLTIMRHQKNLMWGYLIIAIASLLASRPAVARWGMMGAVMLYNGMMLALCGVFVVMIFIVVKKYK
ncbi:lipopolysaccharide biosynthesis protein [Butyrivibrio sp. XPD2006]|uniref:lipopolysaccharide biosynthesis protein n=1 Tax=Butyrivibrio sp. XPD2006 TaxID=1280668 RepID=UPI0003B4E019|nr:hypothetical protein [Butyrivibrio sp. XPD2006]